MRGETDRVERREENVLRCIWERGRERGGDREKVRGRGKGEEARERGGNLTQPQLLFCGDEEIDS